MIHYRFGRWGVSFALSCSGSVFPKAASWAVPLALYSAGLAWVVERYFSDWRAKLDLTNAMTLWSAYAFVLGFLLVFRTNIAYQRFWEGGTTLQQVQGVWFNATSSLIAFCSSNPDKKAEVELFQHLLVRLMSMLYCEAIVEVSDTEESNFQILGCDGMGESSLRYLSRHDDRTKVILQWVQKLVVMNLHSGVIPIPAPIVSRVFQELSAGIVDVQNLKKIYEIPFPFPYAQMLTTLLLLHWISTPIMAAVVCKHPAIAAFFTFSSCYAYWGINYIAAELEMPFGDDANDLPIEAMQQKFNTNLCALLDPMTQTPPTFEMKDQFRQLAQPRKNRLSSYLDEPVVATSTYGKLRRTMVHWESDGGVSRIKSHRSTGTNGTKSSAAYSDEYDYIVEEVAVREVYRRKEMEIPELCKPQQCLTVKELCKEEICQVEEQPQQPRPPPTRRVVDHEPELVPIPYSTDHNDLKQAGLDSGGAAVSDVVVSFAHPTASLQRETRTTANESKENHAERQSQRLDPRFDVCSPSLIGR